MKSLITFQYRGAVLSGNKLNALTMMDGEWKAWGPKTLKAAQRYAVGDYIEVEGERDEHGNVTVLYPSTMLFSASAHEEEAEQVMEWSARDKAARAEKKARSLKKDRDALTEALAPVREIYRRQVGSNRVAMLAVILNEIGA